VTEEELPARYCARVSVTAIGVRERATQWYSELRCIPQDRKTNPKVAVYGSPVLYPQLLNCTKHLVGGLGVPGASYPLVYSHLESGEIPASAQFRPRNQIALLSEPRFAFVRPNIFAVVMAPILSEHNRSRLAMERATARSHIKV
jgi:hypothetical protein